MNKTHVRLDKRMWYVKYKIFNETPIWSSIPSYYISDEHLFCGCVWRSLWAKMLMGRSMWSLASGIQALQLSSHWTRTRRKVRANTQRLVIKSLELSLHIMLWLSLQVFKEIHTLSAIYFFPRITCKPCSCHCFNYVKYYTGFSFHGQNLSHLLLREVHF